MSLKFPGDADILIEGKPYRLRLTLGALAHLEAEIGGGDFEALRERLKRPSAGDLLLILHALIAGGGEAMALDFLEASDVDFADAARAVGKAFNALAGERAPGKAAPAAKVEIATPPGKYPPRRRAGVRPGPPQKPPHGAPGSATR